MLIPAGLTSDHVGREMSGCVGVPNSYLVADRLGTAHLRVQARRDYGPAWSSRSVGYPV